MTIMQHNHAGRDTCIRTGTVQHHKQQVVLLDLVARLFPPNVCYVAVPHHRACSDARLQCDVCMRAGLVCLPVYAIRVRGC